MTWMLIRTLGICIGGLTTIGIIGLTVVNMSFGIVMIASISFGVAIALFHISIALILWRIMEKLK